jgi:hypothetical protein
MPAGPHRRRPHARQIFRTGGLFRVFPCFRGSPRSCCAKATNYVPVYVGQGQEKYLPLSTIGIVQGVQPWRKPVARLSTADSKTDY